MLQILKRKFKPAGGRTSGLAYDYVLIVVLVVLLRSVMHCYTTRSRYKQVIPISHRYIATMSINIRYGLEPRAKYCRKLYERVVW